MAFHMKPLSLVSNKNVFNDDELVKSYHKILLRQNITFSYHRNRNALQ